MSEGAPSPTSSATPGSQTGLPWSSDVLEGIDLEPELDLHASESETSELTPSIAASPDGNEPSRPLSPDCTASLVSTPMSESAPSPTSSATSGPQTGWPRSSDAPEGLDLELELDLEASESVLPEKELEEAAGCPVLDGIDLSPEVLSPETRDADTCTPRGRTSRSTLRPLVARRRVPSTPQQPPLAPASRQALPTRLPASGQVAAPRAPERARTARSATRATTCAHRGCSSQASPACNNQRCTAHCVDNRCLYRWHAETPQAKRMALTLARALEKLRAEVAAAVAQELADGTPSPPTVSRENRRQSGPGDKALPRTMSSRRAVCVTHGCHNSRSRRCGERCCKLHCQSCRQSSCADPRHRVDGSTHTHTTTPAPPPLVLTSLHRCRQAEAAAAPPLSVLASSSPRRGDAGHDFVTSVASMTDAESSPLSNGTAPLAALVSDGTTLRAAPTTDAATVTDDVVITTRTVEVGARRHDSALPSAQDSRASLALTAARLDASSLQLLALASQLGYAVTLHLGMSQSAASPTLTSD
jgi:hypothetical protein